LYNEELAEDSTFYQFCQTAAELKHSVSVSLEETQYIKIVSKDVKNITSGRVQLKCDGTR